MKVLITGGAGFLGQRLARKLLEQGALTLAGTRWPIHQIDLLDVLANDAIAETRVRSLVGDIADPQVLRGAIDQDTAVIFHLAAVVSGQAEADFDLGMRINLDASRALLETCRTVGHMPRVVFTSSVAVYGGDLPDTVLDGTALNPQSSYGTQKAIAELLLADYTRRGFVDGRVLRLPTISVRPGRPNAAASSFASGIIREQQRRAYQLLQEAGWKIVDDKMVDADGKPVSLEFLLAQTDFERVLLPYKRNLADLGIELVIRRVDVSQYINRLRSRDFDMIVGGFGQSSSPGNEQREYWHSASADNPGSRNFIGLKDPAVDSLVEGLINADSRQSLVAHTRALDRVLLAGHYVIPNWHIKTWRVAYWDRLQHPEVTPLYDVGLMTWWAKADAPVAPAPASTEQ